MTERKSTMWLIFLTIFISMVGFGIVIPVLPVYGRNEPFKMSPDELGWLVGIFSLVQLISGPLMGKLSDRIGRRPVLLISIIGTAVGYFITGAAHAPWMLFLGRIIDGASGGNIATAQACIADVTPPQERSKAMGQIGAAFGLGFILGPVLGGVLSQWSHALPFYFAGGLSILNGIFVWAKLPETLTKEKRAHPSEAAPLAEGFAEGRTRFIGSLLMASLLITVGFSFIHLLFALFCHDHLGYDTRQTSYAFAYMGFISVLVQGVLLRRLLSRDGLEKPLAAVGATLLAISLWVLPRTNSTGSFLAVCALMALGNGLVVPILSGMASRHVHGRAQGRVLGLSAAAGSLGRFLGPWLAARMLPANFTEAARVVVTAPLFGHAYVFAFSVAASMIVAGLFFILIMKPLEIDSPGESA